MYKLLVNAPSGLQEIVEVSEGGAYFDSALVIWDERIDGPLPAVELGGMVRVENHEYIAPAIDAVAAVFDEHGNEISPAIEAAPEIVMYGPALEFSQPLADSRAAPIQVPDVVTMAQARKAIILSGVGIAAVEAAIASIDDDTQRELALTDWEYSTVVRRDSGLVQSLAPLLGADLDAMFTLAATL